MTRSLILAAALSALSGAAFAEGFYGTAMLGGSVQANDSAAYGNNIAADADFPRGFDSGNGGVGAIGLGYRINDNFRLEGRLGLHRSGFNSTRIGTGARDGAEYALKGDVESTTFTLEGFYDLPTSGALRPYVKAGIGVARNSYSAKLGGAGVAAFDPFDGTSDGYYDNYSDGKSTEFTWNVGVGASYALNDQVTLFGEYQYVSFGDVKTGQDSFTDGFRVDSEAHEVFVGLRASF